MMTFLFIVVLVLAAVVAWPFWVERRRIKMDGAARTGVPGHFIKSTEGVMRYEWHGPERGPVLVAVHGLTTPPAVFDRLIPELNAVGYRVLTYDLWGRGYSDTPPGDQDAAYFRGQLSELLDYLGLDEDLVLLGYSMGGAIATDYAATVPDRIARLLLLAPTGMQVDEGRFDSFCKQTPIIGDWAHLAFSPRWMAADIKRDLARHRRTSIAEAQTQGLSRQGYLPSVLSSRRGLVSQDQQEEHSALGRADVPVLAVWAEQDNVIPLSALGVLAQWNRNAKQEVIKGAGHGMPFTHAKQVVAALQLLTRDQWL